MKKIGYISLGVAIGMALTVTVSASADGISSLIGKKVSSETTVMLDGVKLDTAIVIDNKSYAPVRKAYESAGYKVDFMDGKIQLTTPVKKPGEGLPVDPAIQELTKEQRLEQVNAKIDILKVRVIASRTAIESLANDPGEKLEEAKAQLAKEEAELEELQKQKAELEGK